MINRIYSALLGNKTLLRLIAVISVVILATFFNRYIESDEAWLAEQSYYFLNEGIVRLKTMPDILNLSERNFVYHKLYTWIGAAVMYLFGFGILQLKISTLLFFLAFIYLIWKYTKIHHDKFETKHFLIVLFLLLSAPIIARKSFSFRPDVLLMLLSFTAYYFLALSNCRKSLSYVMLAGLVAGVGFLVHLNGVAICVAGFLFLLIKKDFRALLIFSSTAIPVCSIYFIDLIPGNNFETFLYQITNWPTVNHGENYIGGGPLGVIWARILKLLSEHKRFFWGDDVMMLSILFFVALVSNFKYLWSKHKDLITYFFLMVFSLNVFGSHIAQRYILFYYPFILLVVSISLNRLLEKDNIVLKSIFIIIVVFHVGFGALQVIEIFNRSYPIIQEHKNILGKIDDQDSKILVPWEMIFNEFENYDLYSYKTYEYLGEKEPSGKMSQLQVLQKANELSMDYLVVNKRLAKDKAKWFYGWKVEKNEYYEIFYQDDESLILKNTNSK